MTRKHYEKVAAILAGEYALASHAYDRVLRVSKCATIRNIAFSLADVFAQENSDFDRKKFYAACEAGIEEFA